MKINSNNLAIISLSVGSFFLFAFVDCYAYLDPGTGSMILQTILAALIGIVAFIGTIRYKIMSFISRFTKKADKANKSEKQHEEEQGVDS